MSQGLADRHAEVLRIGRKHEQIGATKSGRLRIAAYGPEKRHCFVQPGRGDQAFQFIGSHEFTGVGQVRSYQYNGDTVFEINTTDAISGAEMIVVIDPLVTLQAKDFLL